MSLDSDKKGCIIAFLMVGLPGISACLLIIIDHYFL